jgi:hypothetical protein
MTSVPTFVWYQTKYQYHIGLMNRIGLTRYKNLLTNQGEIVWMERYHLCVVYHPRLAYCCTEVKEYILCFEFFSAKFFKIFFLFGCFATYRCVRFELDQCNNLKIPL